MLSMDWTNEQAQIYNLCQNGGQHDEDRHWNGMAGLEDTKW